MSERIGIRGNAPPADVARFVRSHPGIDVVLREAGRLPASRLAQWAAFVRRAGAARVIAEVDETDPWAASAHAWVEASKVDGLAIVAADAVQLASVLADLRGAPCTIQVVWRGSSAAFDDLASRVAGLDVVIACPSPADAASCFNRWRRSPHRLARSSLVPACAAPRGIVVPAWPDDRAAAARIFAPACEPCELRRECEGLPVSWEPPGGHFAGPALFQEHYRWHARLADAHLDALAVESLALQAGLRRVWRLDLETPRAELLAEAIAAGRAGQGPFAGTGFHVTMSAPVTLDERDHLRADGGGGVTIVYVSRDPADGERAHAIEASIVVLTVGDLPDAETRSAALDRELGALLGYPRCCMEAFVDGHRHWRAGDPVAETTFYALRALARSERLDPRLDFTSPLSDVCLIRHYACRFDCPASLELASAIEAQQVMRLGRQPSPGSVATLLYPDAGAVALAGEPEGRALRSPRIIPASAGTSRAARSESLAAALAPLLVPDALLVDATDGAVISTADGGARKLDGTPRLLVFSG